MSQHISVQQKNHTYPRYHFNTLLYVSCEDLRIQHVLPDPQARNIGSLLLLSYLIKQAYLEVPKPSLKLCMGKDWVLYEKFRVLLTSGHQG